MKKTFIILSIIATIFLLGCSEIEVTAELSEQASESVDNEESMILTEEATDSEESEALPEETTGSEEKETPTEGTAANAESRLALELKATDNPRIDELLNLSGTYTDSVGNVDQYVYQIPQFHADSDDATVLNKKILNDVYDMIEVELEAMSGGYSLFCYSITYEVIEYGEIVSILVTAPYPNDCVSYYAYSYDFENHKEVTNTEILATNGITEEDFISEALRREREHFQRQISDMYLDMSEAEMNEYMLSAITETTVDLPMYIDSDGTLNVYVPFPSIAGAEWYYSLEKF